MKKVEFLRMTDEECGSLQIKEKRETQKERERKSFYILRTEQNQRKDRGGKRKTRME